MARIDPHLITTEELIAKIPFPPRNLERTHPAFVPSSVASQTSNYSPVHHYRGLGVESFATESGRQSSENLKPEVAHKGLATIT